ncbi:MAG: hypothetical protein SH850_04670 [Planctomycetaceae bacterium]|nr:hypothetical protein [Planctomycetaceae bacterium]
MRSWHSRAAAIVAGLCFAATLGASAQEPSGPAEPAAAFGIRMIVGPDSVYRYRPERWGTVRLAVVNPLDEPAEVLCSSYFDGAPLLQYGRRCWLPARSRLETSHPVRLPQVSDPKQELVDVWTMFLESGSAGEQLVAGTTGELQRSSWLRLAPPGPMTALCDGSPSEPGTNPDLAPPPVDELVSAGRSELSRGPIGIVFADRLLPGREETLDAVDHLVIADDRILHDPAALVTIRRWLYGGGRLWVMLDRVEIRLLEQLLGDAFAGQEVDRVSLTHVDLQTDQTEAGLIVSIDLDRPVDLVRVLVSNVDVPITVDGWPAAFWQPCGRGRLLVTTIGAAAWVRPREANETSRNRGESLPKYVRNRAYEMIAPQFFAPRVESPLTAPVAERHVSEQIGYEIPARGVIVGWLTLFTASLVGMAFGLSRRGRLERFAGWGPIAALAAAAVLIVAGSRTRAAVPPTTALLQFVQAIDGTDDVQINGTAGIYTSTAGSADLQGEHGGWILPEMAGTEGVARRMIWTDADRWQWENLTQSPGLRTATFRESIALPEPLRVTATFNEQGVVGQLSLPEGIRPSDALLAMTTGRIGVDMGPEGAFAANADRVLTSEQFISAGVLSDEQLRRSRTLSSMFARGFPVEPTLLFWTNPWPGGLSFSERNPVSGSALVSLPVTFSRPATGTVITIPAPLAPYRETSGPAGERPSGFYDYRKRAWSAKHQPSTAWLQFSVPRSLLPLKPLSARVVMQVDGPVGKLQLAGMQGNVPVPFHTWIDPVGTLSHEIADPTWLALTEEGQFALRINAGDPDRPELTKHSTDGVEHVSYWQIESLTLELRARVVDEPSSEP